MYFKSLQVMRGLAATAVVLFHANCYLTTIGGNAGTVFQVFDVRFAYGAWFFFTLSGFMMAYLIDTSYPRFLPRRLVRIYPSFWLAAAITIVVKCIVFGTVRQPKLLSGLSLLPAGAKLPARYPLGIEWTLIYEVFFYAVCSVFARDGLRRWFVHFLTAWGIVLLVANTAFQAPTVMLPTAREIPLSLFNLLFIMGGLTYYGSKLVVGNPTTVQAGTLAVSAAAFAASSHAAMEAARFSCLGLSFSSLILFGVLRDRRPNSSTPHAPGFFEKLGDYSYGIYLVHVPVITVILTRARSAHHLEISGLVGSAAVAAALAAGWYYGKIDLALHRYFKNRAAGPRPAEPSRDPGTPLTGMHRTRASTPTAR